MKMRFGLIFVLAHCASAATFHVSQNSPNASDHNPGTVDQPWLTLAKAASWAQAGDTIVIHTGVYRETLLPENSGAPDHPLLFQSAPGEHPVITGADPVTQWQLAGNAWSTDWPYDFRIGGSDHHPDDDRHKISGRAEQVIVDGIPLRHQFLSLSDMGTTPGSFAVDPPNHRLYLIPPDRKSPINHAIEISVRSAIVGRPNQLHRDYITLRGLTFRFAANFPQIPAVALGGRGDVIEDCIMDSANGRGIDVGEHDAILRRTLIRNCGHTGGGAEGDHFLDEDCRWEGNCWKDIDRGWDAGGFKLTESNDGVFNHCVFQKNGGPGLWMDAYDHDIDIHDCVFEENELDGVMVEISHDIKIDNNLVLNNGLGKHNYPDWSVGGIRLAESYHCAVTHNTVERNRDGITLREQGPRMHGPDAYYNHDHTITYNLIAQNAGYQLGLWYDNPFFGRNAPEKDQYASDDALIADLDAQTAAGKIPQKVFDPTKMNLEIDHNLYFATPSQKLILYGVPWRDRSQKFDALPHFTAATGFDAQSIVADPKMTPGFGATTDFSWYMKTQVH